MEPPKEDIQETRPSTKINESPLKSLRLTEESVHSIGSFRTQSKEAPDSDLSYRYPTIDRLREDTEIIADIEGKPHARISASQVVSKGDPLHDITRKKYYRRQIQQQAELDAEHNNHNNHPTHQDLNTEMSMVIGKNLNRSSTLPQP